MSLFSNSREWIYPKKIEGRWGSLRLWGAVALHLGLLLPPWFTVAGHPAARIDVPARKVFLLGSVFSPADGEMIALIGLIAAFSLFFFTSLFGRLWCGFLCPQTVMLHTWAFKIEEWIEGDARSRRRLDAAPWTGSKIAKKVGKWVAFAAASVLVSMAFMQWFAGPWELWTLQATTTQYAVVAFFAALWFADFVWFREQLCIYLCPYARFQGALADEHSMVVSYIETRGEPRQKGKAAAKEGRCIDCNKCVAVCPQGIDIRDGYQLECITCGLCIDACTDVMGKLGHETLVKHTTLASADGRKTQWIRARTVIYASLLTTLVGTFGYLLATHSTIEAYIARAPGSLFQVDDDGYVRNTYLVKVTNNDARVPHKAFAVEVQGIPTAEVVVPSLELDSVQTKTIPLVVRVPGTDVERTMPFTLKVSSGGHAALVDATFKAPADLDLARGGS